MASDKERAKEWERAYEKMKARAERAEARVQELEFEAKKSAAPKYEEPMSKLVQVAPGKWEYK